MNAVHWPSELRLSEAGRRLHVVFDDAAFDLSAEMLERAAARLAAVPADIAARVRFFPGDARALQTGRTYDASTSLFHVMSYHTTDADLANAIQSARRHLTAGCPFHVTVTTCCCRDA